MLLSGECSRLGRGDLATLTAEQWRERAAEARAMANQLRDPLAKSLLLDIANKYEHMAARIGEESAG